MTGQLNVSRKLLDEYSKSLEEKVTERTRELKDAQANLMRQAHEAGMAEMAVGILHNIGNAITPAKVELSRLYNRMKRKPLLSNLPAACREIAKLISPSSGLSDRERKRFLSILDLTPRAISEEYSLNFTEIEQIRHKLNHIENIIGLQMRYARLFGESEDVDVALVVEDALTMLEDALKKRAVRIIKNYSPVPPIRIEKAQLIQVVVNLIKNGYEAMDNIGVKERRLEISLGREVGPPDYLVLSIKDSGIGFTAEEKEDLFKFGYTTKAKGSGFGLHSCANYLIAKNGSLTAHSGGRGKGAQFVMRLAVHKGG
jgi:signal transduction histidine kinase